MKNLFKNKKTLIAFLGIIGVLLATVGITVAWFSYARNGLIENSITSGAISFIYEENESAGNGVSLEDALPMPDSYGKQLDTYFDFKVKANSRTSKIPYEITLRAKNGSDDIGDSVKVYLTELDGNNEEEKVLSMYNDLNDSTNAIAVLNNEKTLYESEIPAGSKNYTDNYRLRMWLNDNTEDGNVLSFNQSVRQECSDNNYTTKETCEGAGANWLDVAIPATAKTFVLKVNVYANGEAATQEEIASADSTGINNISIAENNAIENVDASLGYDYSISTTDSNATITVDTANPKAKATIVPYDPTAMNSNIIRLSTSKTFPLETGDNYFKVTVKSANKKNESEYILKVIKGLSHDASLSSLSIENCLLNEEFNKDTLSYTCTSEATSLYPVYTLSDSRANAVMANNENLAIGDNSITITVTAEDGETIQTYTIVATFEGNFNYQTVTGDSILGILKDNDLSEGYYKFKINGKAEEYKVHLYTFNGDQVWDTDHTFGTGSDVASGTDEAQMAKHMVAVKVNGDLTNSAKIEPYYTEYGGPKGFTLYVTGTLTNTSTGVIDNSHGAYAKGEDVYLLKNEDGSYEYVPAVGASGGESQKGWEASGNSGIPGSSVVQVNTTNQRATGGGGSGGSHHNTSGAGGAGTSYSGGTGGGGARDTGAGGESGNQYGGKGGDSNTNAWYSGGTGNPGGISPYNNNQGNNGTGGLLIVYAGDYNNSGTLSAHGTSSKNGSGNPAGGASGGGSINVFMDRNVSTGTTDVEGGVGGSGSETGGAGGRGTVTLMKLTPNIVTFNANGGAVTESIRQVIDGHKIGELPTPINSIDFTFDGWYTSLNFTTEVTSSYVVTEDVTLYAKWKSAYNAEIGYTGSAYTYTVLKDGQYKLEVWGAQGGGAHHNTENGTAGKGGYSTGIVTLNKNDVLYVYVGSEGKTRVLKGTVEGGFNGGGYGWSNTGGYSDVPSSGGGATDIRLVKASDNSWYDLEHVSWITDKSLLSRLIVAGGGGGGGMDREAAGAGGGVNGITKNGSGGTQTSGHAFGKGADSTVENGANASYGGPGAGGGWYGGGISGWKGSGGGSGFILTSSTAANTPSGYSVQSKYYLTDAQTIDGDHSMPTHDGLETMIGNTGDGYAKITYLGSSSSTTPSEMQLNMSRSALAGAGLASILNNK